MRQVQKVKNSILSAAIVLMVTACGGGNDHEEPKKAHDNIKIDTSGRLAVSEVGTTTVRVHDLDSSTIDATSFTLDFAPSALYASPNGRYVVIPQRTNDQVQFIDGGVWQEDHGDHLHDYKNAAKSISWKLLGVRPTHFDIQIGKQAAFFMDGNATASPIQNASVKVITDASIAAGNTVASLDLSAPIHGLAEPIDNKLLVVHRAADATTTLPTHLKLFQRSGSTYTEDKLLSTRCEGMHGSASSGAYTLAGCIDGVLLVKHTSATTVIDSKVSTPLRVGTLVAHPKLINNYIAIASEGAAPAPVTTRFYNINGDLANYTEIQPQGWETGRVRRAHVLDKTGNRLFILDDKGTLISMQKQGNAWVAINRIVGAIPLMPAAAPWPALTSNGAREEVYLSDPQAKQIIVINSQTGQISTRKQLTYSPSVMAWTGISR